MNNCYFLFTSLPQYAAAEWCVPQQPLFSVGQNPTENLDVYATEKSGFV